MRELKWDSRIPWASIVVGVSDGVVTLTGVVSSYAQKFAAQEATHRVTGVLDVANDIDVNPVDSFMRTDTEIASAVRKALEWDALVPNELIQSTVSDGTTGASAVMQNVQSGGWRVWLVSTIRSRFAKMKSTQSSCVKRSNLRLSVEQIARRNACESRLTMALSIYGAEFIRGRKNGPFLVRSAMLRV
jgi:hypothetical protein